MRIRLADDTESMHEVYRLILCPATRSVPNFEALSKFAPDFAELPQRTVSHELTFVYQGRDAVAAVDSAFMARTPFDIAILDVRMPPGITGVAAALQIRERHPDLHFIICSAFSDFTWPDLAERFSHGVVIIRKPFDFIELLMTVESIGEKVGMRREIEALKRKAGRE
jgi:DNA-binding NtrC family response regulator